MTITFERTENLALVRELLTNPRCWRRMANDLAPAIDEFQPKFRSDLTYVIARQDERVLALFVLKAEDDPASCEVHFCFQPAVWGTTEDVARAFIAWIWRETPIDTLRGPVPGYNRLALQLAQKVGFRETSREIAWLPKHGKWYDLISLEAHRPRTYRREAGAHYVSPPSTLKRRNSARQRLSRRR